MSTDSGPTATGSVPVRRRPLTAHPRPAARRRHTSEAGLRQRNQSFRLSTAGWPEPLRPLGYLRRYDGPGELSGAPRRSGDPLHDRIPSRHRRNQPAGDGKNHRLSALSAAGRSLRLRAVAADRAGDCRTTASPHCDGNPRQPHAPSDAAQQSHRAALRHHRAGPCR